MDAAEGSMGMPCTPGMHRPAGVGEQGMLTLGLFRNLGGPIPSTRAIGSGEAEPEFSWPVGAVSRRLRGANKRARWWYSSATNRSRAGRGSGVGVSRSRREAGERACRADPVEPRACRWQDLLMGYMPGTSRLDQACQHNVSR